MIDVYFSLGLFLVTALSFFVVGLVYFSKSVVFLKYLEEKYPTIYSRFIFYGYSYNTFKLISFIFDKKRYKDKTIMSAKKLFKKFLLIWFLNVVVMLISGIYLYIRLKFFA